MHDVDLAGVVPKIVAVHVDLDAEVDLAIRMGSMLVNLVFGIRFQVQQGEIAGVPSARDIWYGSEVVAVPDMIFAEAERRKTLAEEVEKQFLAC
jgi:hypothetical protein